MFISKGKVSDFRRILLTIFLSYKTKSLTVKMNRKLLLLHIFNFMFLVQIDNVLGTVVSIVHI